MNISLNKNDEIVMKLLHYFITEEGYNPVVLHGAKDEIWLENSSADYKIVRIVSNYIHNDEQLNFDIFRTKQILKRVKSKMFSFKMNTLSIFVNLGDNVNLDNKNFDNIKCANVKEINDLSKYSVITSIFPNILEIEKSEEKGMELFIKLTNDINKKNYDESKKAEEVFTKKTPYITYVIMIICLITYLITSFVGGDFLDQNPNVLYKFGALTSVDVLGNNYLGLIRLVSSTFIHVGIIHLICNMYSLYVIGPQLESFFGKTKFIIIYILSGVIGNLLSLLFMQGNVVTAGAGSALFGLLGALLYFGYHYRVYLSTVIKSQIIPIIILNLLIVLTISGGNDYVYIVGLLGSLFGGLLVSKSVGVKYKSSKADIINGIIMSSIFIISLIYFAFMG